HELDDPHYRANPTNRCFFCKTELWRRLLPEARARGLAVACDGTNAEDLRGEEHRPGYAAGQRAGIRSPLAEVGMTKPEIRAATAAGACCNSSGRALEAVRRAEHPFAASAGSLAGDDAAACARATGEVGAPGGHTPDAQVSRRRAGRARGGALRRPGTCRGG